MGECTMTAYYRAAYLAHSVRAYKRSTSHFIIDFECDEACNLDVAQNL
jgi:hypothetical protein